MLLKRIKNPNTKKKSDKSKICFLRSRQTTRSYRFAKLSPSHPILQRFFVFSQSSLRRTLEWERMKGGQSKTESTSTDQRFVLRRRLFVFLCIWDPDFWFFSPVFLRFVDWKPEEESLGRKQPRIQTSLRELQVPSSSSCKPRFTFPLIWFLSNFHWCFVSPSPVDPRDDFRRELDRKSVV